MFLLQGGGGGGGGGGMFGGSQQSQGGGAMWGSSPQQSQGYGGAAAGGGGGGLGGLASLLGGGGGGAAQQSSYPPSGGGGGMWGQQQPQQPQQQQPHQQQMAGPQNHPGGEARNAHGVLITGCQAHETSADACPSGDPSKAFGALTNALVTSIRAVKRNNPNANPSHKQLVQDVRSVLLKARYTQNPCLECTQSDVDAPFIG